MQVVSYVAIAALVVLAVFVAVLAVRSPGRVRPVTDSTGAPVPGSIAEKIRVDLNGAEQGMVIRSVDPASPVLLIVHGGPGMPEYFLDATMPTHLEDEFTVVWWDQRGAGLSYTPAAAEQVTVDVLVDDTIAVADYLRERFDQPKVYILAHSWGSYIGIRAVERAPDRFYAYIGMGQIVHQIESEKIAYDYALAHFTESGDAAMVRRLEAAEVTTDAPLPQKWNAMRDGLMHELGVGTTRDMDSVVTGVFLPSWRSPEYTLTEKIGLWRGKIASKRRLWDEFMSVDMREVVTSVTVPVYFVHGTYDYTTSYVLARDYFDRLQAPVKGFYTFEDSAHSPAFEQPDELLRVLSEDVLTGQTDLADPE